MGKKLKSNSLSDQQKKVKIDRSSNACSKAIKSKRARYEECQMNHQKIASTQTSEFNQQTCDHSEINSAHEVCTQNAIGQPCQQPQTLKSQMNPVVWAAFSHKEQSKMTEDEKRQGSEFNKACLKLKLFILQISEMFSPLTRGLQTPSGRYIVAFVDFIWRMQILSNNFDTLAEYYRLSHKDATDTIIRHFQSALNNFSLEDFALILMRSMNEQALAQQAALGLRMVAPLPDLRTIPHAEGAKLVIQEADRSFYIEQNAISDQQYARLLAHEGALGKRFIGGLTLLHSELIASHMFEDIGYSSTDTQ